MKIQKKKSVHTFLIMLPLLLLISYCKDDSGQKPIEQEVRIYMIAPEGSSLPGKMIGCNDILVYEEKTVKADRSILEAALTELIAFKSTAKLQNYVKGPGLMLIQVTVAGGIADVYLKGDFDIFGTCDAPRIKEQIYETVNQFTEYKKINFFINDQTLEKYLSVAGAYF
ncbi:MAG: GerMN domain-containing protein [Melioribacteraceae bacterium]|nr:GerMN domain-containing protein [Melioribacteraceae bacterium]